MYRLSAFFFARMASDLPMDFAGMCTAVISLCIATIMIAAYVYRVCSGRAIARDDMWSSESAEPAESAAYVF